MTSAMQKLASRGENIPRMTSRWRRTPSAASEMLKKPQIKRVREQARGENWLIGMETLITFS